MADPVTLALIGAGVSGGSSLLRGKGLGQSLENAAIGGALGYGGGYLGQAAGLGGATAGATNTVAPSLVSESMPLAFTQGAENAFSAASPYSLGYTSSGVSPFTPAAESMAIPSAADIGAGFGTADLSNMAVNDPTLWERIKPYATIQNLSGAANIYDKFAPKYQPAQISGGGGGIQRGQAPQGTDVTALIQSQKPYQRKKISLL